MPRTIAVMDANKNLPAFVRGLWAPAAIFELDRVWVGHERLYGADVVTAWVLEFGLCAELEGMHSNKGSYGTSQTLALSFKPALALREEVLAADDKMLPNVGNKIKEKIRTLERYIVDTRMHMYPSGASHPALARLDFVQDRIRALISRTPKMNETLKEQIDVIMYKVYHCWSAETAKHTRNEPIDTDEVAFHTMQLDIVWAVMWKLTHKGWGKYES